MKTKSLFLIVTLGLIASTCFDSCKKDTSADPADQFVGSYNYLMTITGMGSPTGTLTVTKSASNKIIFTYAGWVDITYTVNGSSITEDTGQTAVLPIQGGTASYNESSIGSLSGTIITINGTWSKTGYNTVGWTVVATKN
jgi:hypothetical protein